MILAKQRREVLEKKAAAERAMLSTIHVISTVDELEQVFADIDDSEGSSNAKSKKKLAVLKDQVRVRKKLLKQCEVHSFW